MMRMIITLKTLFLTLLAFTLNAQYIVVHKSNGHANYILKTEIDSITIADFGSVTPGMPCPGIETLTDIDGNVYNTILIGTQCWMKENLKTTRYKNGVSIAYPGSNNSLWLNNTTGAYAWYDNDPDWEEFYGALYNWYAVININGLCPTGWRVPDKSDLDELMSSVNGPEYPSGNTLKSCRSSNSPLGGDCSTDVQPYWNYHHEQYGTDDFGFSMMPGGMRKIHGMFSTINESGQLWSSTHYGSTYGGHVLIFHYTSGSTARHYGERNAGLSVRCLKD
jgi:uncharacterized protein (TIGR02145 family)